MKNVLFLIFMSFHFFFYSQGLRTDTVTVNRYYKKALTAKFKNPERINFIYDNILKELNSNQQNNWKSRYQVIYNIGTLNYYGHNHDSARLYYKEALNLAKSNNNVKEVGKMHMYIAMSYARQSKLNEAAETYLKSLDYFNKSDDSLSMISIYNNLGKIYEKLEVYEEAKKYYSSTLELSKALNDTTSIMRSKANLGIVLMRLENFDKALKLFLEAESIILSLNKQPNRDEDLTWVYLNLSELYKLQKEYDLSLVFATQALGLIDNTEFKEDYIKANTFMAECYFFLGKEEIAKKHALTAYNQGTEPNLTKDFVNVLDILSSIYEKENNFEQAHKLKKQYHYLKDSLVSKENLKAISELFIKYESEKKDKEILTQNLKIKEQENKVLKTSKTKNSLIVITAVLLILCISIFIFFRQKQSLKNKEIEDLRNRNKINNLTALMDGEEKERERLAKELHDGILGELAAIKHQISLFNKVDQVKKDQSMSTLDSSINQIRNISHNLAPPIILDSNLIDALKYYCSRVSSTFCKIHFQSFGEYKKLDTKVETSIYRIVQELLTNIKKHSKATKAIVEIGVIGKVMRIVVEDNGIGMQENVPQKGIGLNNIKSRLKVLNADLEIDTSNKGTAFYIELNIDEHQYDSVYEDVKQQKVS